MLSLYTQKPIDISSKDYAVGLAQITMQNDFVSFGGNKNDGEELSLSGILEKLEDKTYVESISEDTSKLVSLLMGV